MKKILLQVFLLTAILFPTLASALPAKSTCKNIYFGNQRPYIFKASIIGDINASSIEHCFDEYAVIYVPKMKISLISSEFLEKQTVVPLERAGLFHEFTNYGIFATLDDFAGWDKGHLLASADFLTKVGQFQSYSLANVIPQNMNNNRGIWKAIENKTRAIANVENGVFVLTAVYISRNQIMKTGNGVFVPNGLFKVIYSPKSKAGIVYFVDNSATKTYTIMSIADAERILRINLFPSIKRKDKYSVLNITPLSKTYKLQSNFLQYKYN